MKGNVFALVQPEQPRGRRPARSVCTVCGHVTEKVFLLSAVSLCTEKECLENLTGALLSHRCQMGMFST